MMKVFAALALAVVVALAVGGTTLIMHGVFDSDQPAPTACGSCCSAAKECCPPPQVSPDPFEAGLQCLALCALHGDATGFECCLELGCDPTDYLPIQPTGSKVSKG